MSTTLPNMSLVQPTAAGDVGTWDDELSADLALIDAHTHAAGKGVKVPTAGIDIDADLDMNGFSAVDLRAACFAVQATFATHRSLWVKTSDNGLYWTDATGTSWKLADSTGINMSLVGGIAGDYAASAASLYYDSAAKAYRMLQVAPTPNVWASAKVGDLDLHEKASGISTYVRLKSPATLAASYTVTFPAAVPASTLLVQMSSAGVLTASNAIANPITSDVTLSADKHVTVSGTGEFKHGTRSLQIHPYGGSWDANWGIHADGYMLSAGVGVLAVPVPLLAGDRIVALAFAVYGDGAADLAADSGMYIMAADGTRTGIAVGAITNPAAAWTTVGQTMTPHTMLDTESAFILFDASAANLRIGMISVAYTHP